MEEDSHTQHVTSEALDRIKENENETMSRSCLLLISNFRTHEVMSDLSPTTVFSKSLRYS